MKQFTTTNGCKIYRVTSLRSNSFLIVYKDIYVLVDTGAKADEGTLLMHLAAIKPEGKKISFLILTHTHFDHCQNARTIKDRENCKIIVSRNEGEYVLKGYTPLTHGKYPVTEFLTSKGREIGDKWFGYDAFSPDILVEDKYDLSAEGLNIDIIATPGHSSGSVSIIVDHEIAMVGDAMINSFIQAFFPPFFDDRGELIKSWKKLLDTGCNLFLPGHGKPVPGSLLEKEYLKIVTI